MSPEMWTIMNDSLLLIIFIDWTEINFALVQTTCAWHDVLYLQLYLIPTLMYVDFLQIFSCILISCAMVCGLSEFLSLFVYKKNRGSAIMLHVSFTFLQIRWQCTTF